MNDEKRLTIDGHEIELAKLGKPLFPDGGPTKGELIDYYRRIAPTALRHYRDRPLTMQRFPDGITEEGFYQKNRSDYYPDWIRGLKLKKEDGYVEHVLVDDTATLVYLANQACITLHPALARADRSRPSAASGPVGLRSRPLGRRLHAGCTWSCPSIAQRTSTA